MDIKIKVKNTISNHNPLAIYRRRRMQKSLENKEVTLLCPNCLGGMLLHDLEVPFLTPTINLMMHQREFLKFVLDINYYMVQKLQFYDAPGYSCPCATLGKGEKIIHIYFTHYSTEEESRNCWVRRCKRIKMQNIFIVLMEKDGITQEDIINLKNIKVRGLVVFTAHKYENIPYTCFIPKYENRGTVGNILKRSYLNDKKEYERYFNFVKWFNEAQGGDYNCRPYCR